MSLYVPNNVYLYEADEDNLIRYVQGNGIVSGCAVSAQSTPNMSVAIASGSIQYSGAVVAVSAVASQAVTASDPLNPRIDMISITSAGVVTYTAGTAAPTPIPPSLPAGSILVSYISVSAGALTIVAANLTDRRLTIPGGFGTQGPLLVVSTGALAFQVGPSATVGAFVVDASAASAATGIKVTSAAAAAGAGISVISTGTNEPLTIDAKGSGTITIGSVSTGSIALGPSGKTLTLAPSSGAVTIAAGGLTITAGGLTVTAGGAVVNTSLTGTAVGTGSSQVAVGNHTAPAATATVGGHLPNPPNDRKQVLLGDATFGALPGNYNYLTNPGFEIDQRGGTVTATAAYAHDRWQLTLAGTDTATVTDETSIVDTTSGHSLKAVVVVGTGAGASNVGQVLKNADLGAYSLKGQTVDFAIRVRTATASACKAAITTDGTGGTTTLSSFHTGGGAFETLSASVAVPTDATTLTVKVTFAASCTAYLDNATLVIGSTAQTYYPLTPAEEWERCQRYYEVLGGGGSYIRVDFSANGASDIAQMLIFATRKAATPTVTKAGTWTLVNCAAQPFIGNGNPSVMGYSLGVSTSAAGAGHYNTDSTDDLISSEANP